MKRIIIITLLILAFTIPATAQDCLVKQLRSHARGLTYMSEADSTIYVFSMQNRSKRAVEFMQRATRGQQSADSFDAWSRLELARLAGAEIPEATINRHRALFELMNKYLRDVKVVKLGHGPVYQIYIYGRDLCGNVVGIRMRSVET